jgi:hypothetical protein
MNQQVLERLPEGDPLGRIACPTCGRDTVVGYPCSARNIVVSTDPVPELAERARSKERYRYLAGECPAGHSYHTYFEW